MVGLATRKAANIYHNRSTCHEFEEALERGKMLKPLLQLPAPERESGVVERYCVCV